MASQSFSRRRFFTTGAAAAIGSELAASSHAQAKNQARTDFLKIGIILGGGNHAQNMWARLINAVPNTNNIPYTPRRTNMLLTHVWSPIPEWAENFAGTFDVENVVKRFDGMIGKVDGVIIDAFFGTPYYHHLAKPYIEAGIPLMINRPFSDSVRKAKEIAELARQYKTPIMTGSSFEYIEFTMCVKNRYPYKEVIGFDSYNSTDDFYSHGVHGILMTYACVGGNMQAISHKTESWIKGGGNSYIVYKDRGKGPFMGVCHDRPTGGYLCGIKYKGSDQMYGLGPCNWDQFMWIHMIQRAQEMFETGSMPDTYDQIVEKTAMFVGAFRSILREKGDLVDLDDLDEDWAIGPPWGHSGNPTMEEQKGYSSIFGEEKGELRPDRTLG